MTVSAKTHSPMTSLVDEPIPEREFVYLSERLRNRLFDCILSALAERVRFNNFNKSIVARRMNKNIGQVSKLLSYPSNLTIDTLSRILAALGADLTIGYTLIEHGCQANFEHPWSKRLNHDAEVVDLNRIHSAYSNTRSASGVKVTSSHFMAGGNSNG